MIGDRLAEARTRRKVDLEDVHAATGIRPRYLQAIEQEEWDALPEDFYARSFIRKYAQFLGVAPEPLVEEFRRARGSDARGGAPTTPFARTTSRRAEALRRRRRQEVYTWIGGAAVLAAVVVAIVLVLSSGGGGGKTPGTVQEPTSKAPASRTHSTPQHQKKRKAVRTVALTIEPTAEVWACVENASGKRLVDAQILSAGETVGPFRSRSYTAAFGNGSVAVRVDGKRVKTPSTSSPMGFSVNGTGKLHELPKGKRPSCE